VKLRVVEGKAMFEPSDTIRAQGNELWVGDKQIVVQILGLSHSGVAESAGV
jgi:hypothetical protein